MSFEMLFSSSAGRRERMLKRQYDNPLFAGVEVDPLDIQQARREDAAEVEAFVEDFRQLVQQVVELEPSADVEKILKLKESLDKHYEISAGLAGDQEEIRGMIKRLLSMMMQSMWKAVGNDIQARSKLEMEEQARQAHFALLEHPFIADLLAPDSLIGEQQLVPCLLSEDEQSVALALQLFEPEQQQLIYQQAHQLLETLDESHPKVQQARQRLQQMAAQMQPANHQPG